MAECKMYGCRKQATLVIDIWGFCEQHAEEYRKRFADALKEQQKRNKSKEIRRC